MMIYLYEGRDWKDDNPEYTVRFQTNLRIFIKLVLQMMICALVI